MRNIIKTFIAFSVVSSLALSVNCGQKTEERTDTDEKTADYQTDDDQGLPIEGVPFAPELSGAGYEVVYYTDYPATIAGRGGKMILYGSASGDGDGGMVYVEESGPRYNWVWHWYFEDATPTSASRAEINEDGLWDIGARTKDGRRFEFIQDDTYTLVGGSRDDRIALNGTCSEPLEGHPLWHCFDGNSASSFRSALSGRKKPFIEVASPFGLADGILSIQSLEVDQPKDCEILVEGKKVQSFQLQATTGEQLIHLDSAVKTAKRIRLVIESCYGDGEVAAVAELSIR